MAKQLTEREKYLDEHVSEITTSNDPFSGEIESLRQRLNDAQSKLNNTVQQLNSLEVINEPVEPQPKVKTTAGVTFGITAAVVIVLFVFHCIIWLLRHIFNISWDTWGWTTSALLYGVIISAICTAIAAYKDKKNRENYENWVERYNYYVQTSNSLNQQISQIQSFIDKFEGYLDQLYQKRFDTLGYAINSKLGLPCPFSAISGNNYSSFKNDYLTFLNRQEKIARIVDKEERMKAMRNLMDDKLEFLYKRSIKAEVSPNVYKEFSSQFGKRGSDDMVLRKDLPTVHSNGVTYVNNLPTYKQLLDNDTLTPIIQRFNAVTNRDTHKSGFFSFMTDTDKKAEQTKDMQTLAKAAKSEYDELMDINAKVSYALDFARGCAYRNIYLGAELINYVRSTHAGGSMTKEQDNMTLTSIKSDGLKMDLSGLNVDVSGSALGTLAVMGNAVMDNKGLQQLVKDNPKVSLGIAAVATIGSAAVSYFSSLSHNADAQKKMIDAIKAISEGYTVGKGNMLRAIEIIGAIVNCNNGFMAIYEPLRKKVFDDGDFNLTKDEQINLSMAINKYKKVADTKLK